MKTVFFQQATNIINAVTFAKTYFDAKPQADFLNGLIDRTRDVNGKKPIVKVDEHSFTDRQLFIDIFFEGDASDEAITVASPIKDFQAWVVWNRYAIWYRQELGLLEWNQTLKEEINASHVLAYMQDICAGCVAYKQAEFSIHNYQEGETFDRGLEDSDND